MKTSLLSLNFLKQKLHLVLIILILGLGISCTGNEPDEPDDTIKAVPWTKGSGTIDDPYLIEIPGHLLYLSQTSNDKTYFYGNYIYNNCYFKIVNDLNMNSVHFTPIFKNRDYLAVIYLDGNNKTISNLNINLPDVMYVGLFGFKYGGTIKNLKITNSVFNGGQYVGSFAGYAEMCAISGCSFKGTVSGTREVGGIYGHMTTLTATNCFNEGSITASTYYAGGIAGSVSYGTISNCYNTGSVNADIDAGGITGGFSSGASTIKGSYNKANITATTNAGGIIGLTGSLSTGKHLVQDVYNTGNVTATSYASGVIGSCNSGEVRNSYTVGTVTATTNSGGLLNMGPSSYTSTVSTYYAYYVASTAGSSSSYTGESKTSANMKLTSFITSLNQEVTSAWKADAGNINNGYPILLWQ